MIPIEDLFRPINEEKTKRGRKTKVQITYNESPPEEKTMKEKDSFALNCCIVFFLVCIAALTAWTARYKDAAGWQLASDHYYAEQKVREVANRSIKYNQLVDCVELEALIFQDTLGNEFSPKTFRPNSGGVDVTLRSPGRDGELNTKDDYISNFHIARTWHEYYWVKKWWQERQDKQ